MTPQPGFTPHISTLGQGPRRALALHCTLAFGGAWAAITKIAGDHVTFVAPDMPSHGRSPDWDEVSDFGETSYRASLAAMDDAPMDIIGHSFGGATALRIAVDHPDRVRSLTLFEPVLFAVARADAPHTLDAHDAAAAPFHEAIQAGDRAAAARAFNGMWSHGPEWDAVPERSRAAMTRAVHVVPDTVPFLYDDVCGLLAPGVLEGVTVPAAVLRGEHALPAIRAVTQGLARRLGNAEEVVIKGAGHMGPITHPAEVAAAFADVRARS